jgi:hypothetical protein
MIISHQYKFIFIKTNKTAGTSVEVALSKYCNNDDIVTPISDKDEKIRSELGYQGPQNYTASFGEYGLLDYVKFLFLRKQKMNFYNHMSASEIKRLVGDNIWHSYYKFCIERNPCDRLISHYYWVNRKDKKPSFSEYLSSQKPQILKQRGIGLYTIKFVNMKIYKMSLKVSVRLWEFQSL